MVEPSILIKPGVWGHLGRETAPYGANSVRKIGRSSLLRSGSLVSGPGLWYDGFVFRGGIAECCHLDLKQPPG